MDEARNVIKEGEHLEVPAQTETHTSTGTASRFEGVSGAINVSIVAFSIVFAVLLILTAMIYAVRIFAADEKKDVKKNDSKPSAPAAAVTAAKAAAPVQAVSAAPAAAAAQSSGTPQTKIVAAITAAIVAATGGMGRIVSIQPQVQAVSGQGTPNFGAGAWKTSGRIALVNNRLTRAWR